MNAIPTINHNEAAFTYFFILVFICASAMVCIASHLLYVAWKESKEHEENLKGKMNDFVEEIEDDYYYINWNKWTS